VLFKWSSIRSLCRIRKLFREIYESLTEDIAAMKEKLPNFVPGLAIIQVGNREDSNVYIKMKINKAKEIGINTNYIKLLNTTTEYELIKLLNTLNDDPNTHGIIVQMPLDNVNKINSQLITDSVSPAKDVDG
jgi:methylenetetrahydrofolate dehydrogenase (NADP+)/methenyltetrahydrofolate cyclohydrolase/formyltetrahydrofolate synthetase